MTRRMIRSAIRSSAVWLGTAVLLGVAAPAAAAAESPKEGGESAQAAEEQVQQEVQERLAERRQQMLAEAQVALDETQAALAALEKDDTDTALESLARATGKLELLVARDPELALAPVDVGLITHDLYATPEAIRRARDEAEELLEDGRVQEARTLLMDLASEVIVRVTSLPLATYPDAIKAVSPLIDEGKLEEARDALRAALSTLVVTDRVISLPVLRAHRMLDEAQRLVEEQEASEQETARIDELVQAAREQLEMAELLGYGTSQEHETFRKQIAELEKKLRGDQETQGVFARLRRSLEEYQTSFLQ